jgi:hypothetical protein
MSLTRVLITTAVLLLSISAASAQNCWVNRSASGQVLGWVCTPPPAPAPPYGGGLDPTIPLRATHPSGPYGPDWDMINRSNESALRQQILQEQLRQLQQQR